MLVAPQVQSMIAVTYVRDIDASRAFYGLLGFREHSSGKAGIRQRWAFGPGEDHNYQSLPHTGARRKQRWAFRPGEDHNTNVDLGYPALGQAAPGLRPRRGSQLQPPRGFDFDANRRPNSRERTDRSSC